MDTENVIIGLAELNAICSASYQQTGNELMKLYADYTNEAIRMINGEARETRMTEKDKDNVLDWIDAIIDDPENWHRWYSDAEVKLLAELAKQMIEELHTGNTQRDTYTQTYTDINGTFPVSEH